MQFSLFDGNKKLGRVGEPVDLEEIGVDILNVSLPQNYLTSIRTQLTRAGAE